jgi:inhibitor of cysteine peptidase
MALFLALAALALGPASNGHTYSVAPSTKIAITLPSNASTGYRWRLAGKPAASVVKFVSHHYVAPKPGSNPGAAGKEIWRFRAVGKGTTRLRLTYVQAGSKHVARAFRVKLHVR